MPNFLNFLRGMETGEEDKAVTSEYILPKLP